MPARQRRPCCWFGRGRSPPLDRSAAPTSAVRFGDEPQKRTNTHTGLGSNPEDVCLDRIAIRRSSASLLAVRKNKTKDSQIAGFDGRSNRAWSRATRKSRCCGKSPMSGRLTRMARPIGAMPGRLTCESDAPFDGNRRSKPFANCRKHHLN